MNKARIAAALISLTTAEASTAQSSDPNALLGQKTWAAFQCAALAANARNEKERERLFTAGYESGTAFLTALRSGNIKPEDILSRVPMGVMLKVAGPNIDFVLGRIWEAASENALREVFELKDEEGRVLAANKGFVKRNCGQM